MIRLTSPAPTFLLTLAARGLLPTSAAGAEWIEHRKIYGSDTDVIDDFAEVMALDGDRLLVGVPRKDPSGRGAAYLFERRAGALGAGREADGLGRRARLVLRQPPGDRRGPGRGRGLR